MQGRLRLSGFAIRPASRNDLRGLTTYILDAVSQWIGAHSKQSGRGSVEDVHRPDAINGGGYSSMCAVAPGYVHWRPRHLQQTVTCRAGIGSAY